MLELAHFPLPLQVLPVLRVPQAHSLHHSTLIPKSVQLSTLRLQLARTARRLLWSCRLDTATLTLSAQLVPR